MLPNELDEANIRENIGEYSSEKLAEIIIAHRYLGMLEGPCIIAMEELTRRRETGDGFQYEAYIQDNLASLPELSFPKVLNLSHLVEMFGRKR